jgi:hypothetical protein
MTGRAAAYTDEGRESQLSPEISGFAIFARQNTAGPLRLVTGGTSLDRVNLFSRFNRSAHLRASTVPLNAKND